jgi:membrane peptidoglycan carboxypeptidase
VETRGRWWLIGGAVLFTLLVVAPVTLTVGSAGFMYWRSARDLPQPADTVQLNAVGATQLYDRTGETLLFAVQDPLGDERTWITLESLPPYLIDATLIMEDSSFLETPKAGLLQTLTRLWENAVYGPLSADPSLTARLVRNAIAPPGEFTSAWDREREIALVAEINRRYTPNEILEWHLNTNYYGNEAYGIQAAARVYLGKNAQDLTLDEAALLAAIPPAPQYNPLDNDVAAFGRQDDVLRAMQQAGKITTLDYDLAVSTLTPIQIIGGQTPEIAPDFALDRTHV